MPGPNATFTELREAGVSLQVWMDHHRGINFIAPAITTFEEWIAKVHVLVMKVM